MLLAPLHAVGSATLRRQPLRHAPDSMLPGNPASLDVMLCHADTSCSCSSQLPHQPVLTWHPDTANGGCKLPGHTECFSANARGWYCPSWRGAAVHALPSAPLAAAASSVGPLALQQGK
ncbi:hypothetical protein HaLaN_28118 [Haematococcus lacustris]|uniref:Uncharacterized protein n=1 Tax=Haematococcus lacustris TaxID=44745 RepID=A0A6A0A9P9_HAELA|nr:hypothetical protein HaLaN_28118 [Haematococcus lacustris]